MANEINADGLEVYTREELVALFTAGFEAIYGADANFDQDSPDGQMINLFIQSVLDTSDLLKQIYNSFDPDSAIGKVLDQRIAYNGIQRQGGTFSRTPIEIISTQKVTLYGLDQEVNTPYTVSDDENNEWKLLETIILPTAGTYDYDFQASESGLVLTTPNTITKAVTVILGIDSVNNPDVQSLIGTDEETDSKLKIRRQRSVALASQGFLASTLAALLNVDGVTSAAVYENNSGATDGDGIPSHSIWVIVSGNYDDVDIASVIYKKRNAGCGMFGAVEYTITQVDTTPFIIKWDIVETDEIFVKINLESISGAVIDYDGIRSAIPEQYIPDVYETVNTNVLASIVDSVDDNALIDTSGFAAILAGPYTSKLTPAAKKNQFLITEDKVILLPVLLEPSAKTVANLEQVQFSTKGGYGTYNYTLHVDSSGGSVVAGTGLYTAGSSDGDDTIRVTDQDGNTTDVVITVA